ncbi:MAG: hypothetical protein QOF19_3040 [Alphaproteobacteria bacterium]|jgi:uncharacterized membrane protein YcfT|nr:hypothetical protein [Alphaproteobacteria bacterium]
MSMKASASMATGRVDWVDYAKGFCIVMVVMMHSTLGVEAAAGQQSFMHALVAFAKPFRMPDFFLLSGLFLRQVLDRDWRTYLDRKVVHFAYFYVLWMTIQFAFKAPAYAMEHGAFGTVAFYLESFVEPFGTLWFIYLLPIFFVVTKLTRPVPAAIIWLVAAALEILPIDTGWTVIDEFASRFVYFYTGYLLAPHVFAMAAHAQARPLKTTVILLLWGVSNAVFVHQGYAELPFVSLAMGLLGAAAVVRVSALMAKGGIFRPLRYCGEHSLVIYLAFFLPMAAMRVALLNTGMIADLGVIALLVTAAGVSGPLALFWLVRGSRLDFLFARPERFWLTRKPQMALQPAE